MESSSTFLTNFKTISLPTVILKIRIIKTRPLPHSKQLSPKRILWTMLMRKWLMIANTSTKMFNFEFIFTLYYTLILNYHRSSFDDRALFNYLNLNSKPSSSNTLGFILWLYKSTDESSPNASLIKNSGNFINGERLWIFPIYLYN